MKKARHLNGEKARAYFSELGPPEAPWALEAVQVWVSRLEPEAGEHGLDRERLQAGVELLLAVGGIPLRESRGVDSASRFPCLGVLIHLDRVDGPLKSFVFSLEVFFVQARAAGGPNPADTLQMTWCRETIGDARETGEGLDWDTLYHALGLLVQEFIRDYKAVNPRCRPNRIIN